MTTDARVRCPQRSAAHVGIRQIVGGHRSRVSVWTAHPAGPSRQWSGRVRLGRTQLELTVFRHSSVLPDRWVIKPGLIYDRKERR